MDSIFLRQEIEKLGRNGYVECAAKSEIFSALFAALKRAHPDAKFVEKVGRHAVEQIIYLPRAVPRLVCRLKRSLEDYEKAARCTRAAIAVLEQTFGAGEEAARNE